MEWAGLSREDLMPRANPCLPCLLMAGNPGRKPARLPDPGDLALLGTTLEIKVENDATGQEEVHAFNAPGPNLYWSPALRAVLIFPKKHVRWVGHLGPDPELFTSAGVEKSAKLFQRWAARDPVEIGKLMISDYKMKPYGRAKHIVYRSDKWHPGRTEDYIHDFGPKVRMAVAPGKPPAAIMVAGGRLTVTERGLVY